MNNKDISSIVNISRHPIEVNDYIKKCNLLIKNNSILILKNFLSNSSYNNILNEAKNLESQAFYCKQKHTILLDKQTDSVNKTDILNQLMITDKGCVPHDMINSRSDLNTLYYSKKFQYFIKNVLSLNKIFPYADNLSSINLNYYQKGQQLGWHFDNASFAITLMIQSSSSGGHFEYITEGRNSTNGYLDKKLITNIVNGKKFPKKLDATDGTLILFYGRNYLHRVTPVESEAPRILITLNYNEEINVKLSENARKTFFGRIS